MLCYSHQAGVIDNGPTANEKHKEKQKQEEAWSISS